MLLYMVTFTINISPMLAYIPAPWILWVMGYTIVILNISGMVIIHEKSLLRRYKGTTFGSQQLSTHREHLMAIYGGTPTCCLGLMSNLDQFGLL